MQGKGGGLRWGKGYLEEDKRFFGRGDKVGDVVSCLWERGDEGGGGRCSHRGFFLPLLGGGVESYHPSDHQTPIRPQPVPGYRTKDSATFKAFTTPKRFYFLTGGNLRRPTMMSVDTVRYNNVSSFDLSYCNYVSPIIHTPYSIKASDFFRVPFFNCPILLLLCIGITY